MYKCIIAEDEKQIRNGILNYFDWIEAGFNVLGAAENGKEALKLIKQYNPHLLITDIRMPVMDGLELMEHALNINKNIKIIVLSGYDEFRYAKKAIEYGVCDYILKPINMQELSQSLKRIYTRLFEEDSKRFIMEKGLSLLRDDFLKNIAKGLIVGDDYIQKKAQEFKINTDEYLFYAIRISIDDEDFYTAESKDNKKLISIKGNIALNILNDIINKYAGSSIFNEYGNQISIILYIPEKNTDKASNILQKIINDINKALSYYFKDKIYIGISGEFSNIYGIKNIYEKSEINLQHVILDKKFNENNQKRLVNQVIKEVKKSELKELSLESVARQVFVSPYYLSRVFKQETGENFVDYITKIRIEKAKEIIANFNLSNEQVADIIGYSSAKYFSKVFKKYEGLTPKDFKKKTKKMLVR